MNIVRVEQKVCGAWVGHYQGSWIDDGPGHKPMPEYDGIFDVTSEDYFGFASAAQATAWFNTESVRKEIADSRRIVVYEVPDHRARVGMTQVVFPMELAKLIGHIPPEEWVSGSLNMRDGIPEEWQ
jgi:hypothetical protein